MWTGCGEKGTLLCCWCECKLAELLWRTIQRFLRKLKIELLYDPAIPLLGIYLEKSMVWKDICTQIFTVVLFTIVKTGKHPKCPSMEEWIKKMWYTYTTEYYSAIKKKQLIYNNMGGPTDDHTQCKSDWERHFILYQRCPMISLTCGI